MILCYWCKIDDNHQIVQTHINISVNIRSRQYQNFKNCNFTILRQSV